MRYVDLDISLWSALYHAAVILTHEDCHSRSLARRSGEGDVVHRLRV
jgi:hypothetical protein